MNSDHGSDIDSRLESELRRALGPHSGPSPRAFQSAYHADFLKATRPGRRSFLGSVASSKATVGLAVAALGVGGGSLAAAAATGSPDPSVWGKTVTAAVEQCKDQLGNGIHGIGDCVSAVAKQHGAEARADHSQKNSKDHPAGPQSHTPNGQGNGNGNGNSNGNGSGPPSGTPGGPPSSKPAGPKKTPPAGPAATPPGHNK